MANVCICKTTEVAIKNEYHNLPQVGCQSKHVHANQNLVFKLSSILCWLVDPTCINFSVQKIKNDTVTYVATIIS